MKRLALFFLAFITYSSALFNQYAFDDVIQVQKNELIRNLGNAVQYFWHPVYPGDLYRPITMLTYWLMYQVGHGSAFPDHLLNIVLFGVVVILVYELLKKLTTEGIALTSAILFAVHPIHTEVVASVVGRAELLSAVGILASLLFFTDTSRSFKSAIAGGAFLFGIGLFSKENSIILCGLLPFVFYFQELDSVSWSPASKKRAFASILVCLTIVGIYMQLRMQAIGTDFLAASQVWIMDNPLIAMPGADRTLKAISLLGRYVFLCLYPHPLSADYSFQEITPTWDQGTDGLYLILIILCIGYGLMKKSRVVYFGIGWFFISFLLTSNIFFPIGTAFGERLVFLPSIGLIVSVVGVFSNFPPAVARKAVIAVAALFFMHSFLYAQMWRNDDTLWSYQIQITPQSAKTQQNFAAALLGRGEYDIALIHADLAQKIFPQYDQAALIKGLIYTFKKNKEEAVKWFGRTLEINPHHLGTLNSLGQLYFNTGEKEKALGYFERALHEQSFNFDALLGKGVILFEGRDREKGVEILRRLQRKDPNHPILKQLLAN